MSAILRFAKSRPILFGAGYSLIKTTGCDLMVQKVRATPSLSALACSAAAFFATAS